MTAQEALSLLNDMEFDKNYQGVQEYIEMLLVCKEALEKQIPKKPRASSQSGFFWCPSCERAIKRIIEDSKINISYCPFCGQALDWSENNG